MRTTSENIEPFVKVYDGTENLSPLEAIDAFNENVCKALEEAFNEISTAKETPR